MSNEQIVQDILVWKNPRDLTLSPNNVRKDIEDQILKNQGVFDEEFWAQLNKEEIEDLVASVSERGVRNPIIINQRNEVVAGQRRWLAALKANLDKIPCIQRHYKSDIDEIYDSLAENEKVGVSRMDKYHALKKLRDSGLSLREISARTSIPKSTIHDILKEGDWASIHPTPIPWSYIDKWKEMDKDRECAAEKLMKAQKTIDYYQKTPIDDREVLGIKDEMLTFKRPESDSKKVQPVMMVHMVIPGHIIQKLRPILKKLKLDIGQFIVFLINRFLEEQSDT